MTAAQALEWARWLILEPPSAPWPANLPRVRCRCGLPWFECACAADLNPPGPPLTGVAFVPYQVGRARA